MSVIDTGFSDPKKGVVIRCGICNRKVSLSFEEYEKLSKCGKTDMFINDKGNTYCINCFKGSGQSFKDKPELWNPYWGLKPSQWGRGPEIWV